MTASTRAPRISVTIRCNIIIIAAQGLDAPKHRYVWPRLPGASLAGPGGGVQVLTATARLLQGIVESWEHYSPDPREVRKLGTLPCWLKTELCCWSCG
jgi:hypothetical protein